MTIEKMRKTYAMAGLDQKDVESEPVVQFKKWFDQAQQPDLPSWLEVNAMTLSTTDLSGAVTSRIVLLKGIEDGKFQFFTNHDSTKGQQIDANSQVSLCFFWPHMERQVRIEGIAAKTNRERSESYFHSRPRSSQLGAHVSQQSSVVESRDALEQRMVDLDKQYEQGDIPCPQNWGGYDVAPTSIEFWQGRPSRLHDRICYRLRDDSWEIVRLSP
ncbi:pyridoxamine 5'-phosphate oxidase [Planctomycetes bacterium K23_9]|uniref:Pyridoxine/pyridoxamine 5'-phosphate oxidase n=1 Tax=Stieleria marina TaxID=1930275 RepID=A0A517NNN2_9BACT|nr:Pyridoxine/pyridoxamine 5'-phosphate oxidase [Planctomycetes bacterium K23_9]